MVPRPRLPVLLIGLLIALPLPAVWGAGAVRAAPAQDRGGQRGQERGLAQERLKLQERLRELESKVRARREADGETPLADPSQVRAWFEVCDHNANGWLSFSETKFSLRFTRPRFQAFDEDRDGRLVQSEFDEFYVHSIVHSGRFVPPLVRASEGPPPQRTPEQMRNAYDIDLDGLLSDVELSRLLADYGRESAPVDVVLGSLDVSGNGSLELDELEGLHAVLYPIVLEDGSGGAEAPARAASVAELFGAVEPRGQEPGATPTPPRIVGPVSLFRRLDLDDDGYVTVDDLEDLLRPVRVTVRPHTVVNTLDRDGDFRLSEAEFLAALAAGPGR